MFTHQRFTASLSPAAMIMAIFALVVAAAGVGYSAGTIGTSDLKNNAVTSAKVKNGTLKAADMVKEKRFTYVDAPGSPDFTNGGEGDCVWQSGHTIINGLPRTGFRTDRFGTVHLSGIIAGSDGSGGDALCDPGGAELNDSIVLTLPAAARPKKHVIRVLDLGGTPGTLIIVNKNGLVCGPTSLLPGTVFWSGDPTILLDGISYPAGNTLVFGRSTASDTITPQGRALLKRLGIS